MDGKIDLSISIQHNAMYETISKAMSATLMNHNKTFINSISNAIKEAFNLSPERRGPVYPNSTGGIKEQQVIQESRVLEVSR